MSYAAQRDAFVRTRQDLVVVGVRECANHYATLVQQLLQRTEEMDHAAWQKTSVTVTPNNATAPDGTLTADTCEFNADGDALEQRVTGTPVTSKSFTMSVWLRATSGSPTIRFLVSDDFWGTGSPTENGGGSITLSTSWQRFWVQYKFSATPTTDVVVSLYDDALVSGGTFEVWGWNLWRNPGDLNRTVEFPYRKRVAEAVSTLSVNVSRCSVADQGNGNRCFYSRPTCQDPDNFNAGNTYETAAAMKGLREFRFCKREAPIAIPAEGTMPLITSIPVAAQLIDAERSVTVNDRVTFEFEDEDSPSLWNPRHNNEGGLVNTAVGGGTFWRRFRSIYQNYGNPEGYVIRKVGFVESGFAASETTFQTRGKYLIQNLETVDRRIRLICGDRLKLARKSIPSKISDDNTTAEKLTASDVSLVIDHADEVTPLGSGYTVTLELEPDTGSAEKVNVTAINLTTNTLTITRGRWGTTAVSHPKLSVFREVVEFGTERDTPSSLPLGKNPIDIIVELYKRAGLAASEIDTATLNTERDVWLPSSVNTATGAMYGALFRRSLTESTDVETLAREIRELTMLFLWVNESQQVTGKLFAPIRPTATVTELSDDSNLIAGTIEVDDNDETRLSRALLAWDLASGESPDSTESFNEIRVEIDIDSEEREFYGDQRLKVVLSQWLQTSNDPPLRSVLSSAASYFTRHLISRFRHGLRLMRAKLEIKDDDIEVGDVIRVNTSLIQDVHGNNLNSHMMVTKKRQETPGRLSIEALDHGIFKRFGFYAAAGAPVYSAATETQRKSGYFSDTLGLVGSPKVSGYHYW